MPLSFGVLFVLILVCYCDAFATSIIMGKETFVQKKFSIPSSLQYFGEDRSMVARMIMDEDIPQVSELLLESFPFEISLDSPADFSKLELQVLEPLLSVLNVYLRGISFLEVYLGIKFRRWLSSRNVAFTDYDKNMMIGVFNPNNNKIIAFVELMLRAPDGSLSGNFRIFDVLKENLLPLEVQPYLCNLAVSEQCRGQGIGTQLVRLSEHLIRSTWYADSIYLHVDPCNLPAMNLYERMGYNMIASQEAMPKWLRILIGAPNVQYFMKKLQNNEINRSSSS